MAAFNFPNSPSTNDIHNENGVSFKWNGTVWKKIGTVANQLAQLGVTGISTFTGDVKFTGATSGRDILWDKSADELKVNDNTKISLGTSQDFVIYHNATDNIIDCRNDKNLKIVNDAGGGNETMLFCDPNGAVDLYYNNSLKFSTTSSGVDCPDQLQVDGTTFATGGLKVNADNQKIRLGASDDLEIHHDGNSVGYITNNTGLLKILSDGQVSIADKNNSEDLAKFIANGACELYHNNVKKFETTVDGIEVTGKIFPSSHIDMADNVKLLIGTSDDLQVFHDGSNSFLTNATGVLVLQGNGSGQSVKINPKSGENSIVCIADGATNIYHNNVKKFETASNGVAVAGQVDCTAGGVLVDDNYSFSAGTSGDLLLYHNGSNSYLSNSTGNLMITGNNSDKIHIRAHASKQEIVCFPSAGVQIFYNDSKKFETTNTGVDVQGNIKATGSGTDVTIKPADGLINFGMDGRTSFVTGENSCYIFSGSGASGTIPAGTLILQARSNVDRDIVFVTGSTPAERFRVKGDGTHTISTPMVFAYTPGTTQGLTDATWTKNTWLTSEDIDTDGAFSSSRFTVPSGKAGTYFIAVSTNLYSNDNNMRDGRSVIYKNGSIYSRSYNAIFSTNTSGLRHFTAQNQCIATLSAGDYIENYIYCDTHSGALYMSSDTWGVRGNYMLIYRIG